MRKDFFLFTLMVFFLASCQKEIYFPEEVPVVPVVEKVVSAIVVTNDAQNEFDSIVFRWLPGKTMEVHYSKTGDSITRTYTYDGGRLAKIEDQKALYYTNGAVAHAISFQYNNSGQLIKTVTDFNTRSGIPAYYNMSGSGSVKSVTVFDTSYWGPTYNLGWANRIIYNTVSSDNYLTYDSCIFFNYATGGTSATVSDYTYDGNKNASSIRQHTYQDGQLTEWGDVAVTRDRPAPIYEGMRKKLYRNLTNWYDAGYVLQDDNYRFFTFPGNMYKRMSYSGYSSNGGPVPLQVAKSIEYENEYDKDLLLKSKVSFSLNGQGTIRYVNHIRYYYKLM